jgi:hypothetical protein
VRSSREGSSRLDAAMLFASVAVPMVVAVSRASAYAEPSHDDAVVRGLGLGFSGVWRALDVAVDSLLLPLPLGTRALRAALVGAALGGVAGGLLYALGRSLLGRDFDPVRGQRAARPSSVVLVAAFAAACASLCAAWLREAAMAGSSLLGVVLILAPAALVRLLPGRRTWPILAALLSAALTYEPLVGLVAATGTLPVLLLTKPEKRGELAVDRRWMGLRIAGGLGLGALPFLIALSCAVISGRGLDPGWFRAWAGEGGALVSFSPKELVLGELGTVLPVLGGVGVLLVVFDRRAWKAGAAAVALCASSALAVHLGAPACKEHMSAPALALLGAVVLLAAVPMHRLVVWVREAKLPLASASAAMVLLLESTFPVLTLDEALQKLDAKDAISPRLWDDMAFEPLTPGTLVLVRDRALFTRALASRATGELRGDLTLVPTFDLASRDAERELTDDPNLAPVWRDLVLYGAPRERTLSAAASSRPLAMALEPGLEKGILRHLVPKGLLASLHPEPRGASERLVALDAPGMAPVGDEALATLTARLFDQRAKALMALGEREAATRVEGDSTALLLPTASGEHRPRRLLTPRGSHIATSP